MVYPHITVGRAPNGCRVAAQQIMLLVVPRLGFDGDQDATRRKIFRHARQSDSLPDGQGSCDRNSGGPGEYPATGRRFRATPRTVRSTEVPVTYAPELIAAPQTTRYQITSLLGRGATSLVYKAFDI